ncbi:MAG: hypothetical protein ACTSRC_22455 [Candidatus Helarchaeota archaeon]
MRHGSTWWERFWKFLKEEGKPIQICEEVGNKSHLNAWLQFKFQEFEKMWREGKN